MKYGPCEYWWLRDWRKDHEKPAAKPKKPKMVVQKYRMKKRVDIGKSNQ